MSNAAPTVALRNVHVPAFAASGQRAFSETTVQVDAGTGEVFLDGKLVGVVGKGQNTAQVGGTRARGTAKYFASVDAWMAWLPGSKGREDFDGDRYPAHYRRNTRRGAVAFLLTACDGGAPDSYFSWS